MAERPGLMVYFDKWEPILRLSNTEVGVLFRSAIQYAKYGELPELEGYHEVLFDIIRPEIDRDDANYRLKVMKRKYAVHCREAKKNGGVEMTFEAWLAMNAVSEDITRYTKTTPPSASTSAATSLSTTSPYTKSKEDIDDRVFLWDEDLDTDSFEEKREFALARLDNFLGS